MKLKTILFTLIVVSATWGLNAQEVGEKFQEGTLYYRVTQVGETPELAVVSQNDTEPYWDEDKAPSGTIEIPSKVTYKGVDFAVTSLWAYAFQECSEATEIVMPETISTIGDGAFYECNALKQLVLPSKVYKIGEYAFTSCISLESFKVDAANAHFCDVDGVLYNKEKTTLLRAPAAHARTTYEVLPSVVTLGMDAFGDCVSLKSITLPVGLKIIEASVFYDCTSLTEITLPYGVVELGEDAFSGCEELATVDLPETINKIGKRAFFGCVKLNSFSCRVPDPSAIELGEDVFDNTPTGEDEDKPCTLYVPLGSKNKYMNAEQWKFFAPKIEEKNFVAIDTPETAACSVWTTKGTLHIAGAEAGIVEVYDLAGSLVARCASIENQWDMAVPSGGYIIVAQGTAVKCFVP